MKNKIVIAITLVLVLFVSCVTTQTIEPYVEIIEVPNQTKNELFVKANTWAVRTFRDAKSVIEYSDKEEGIISGKYIGQPDTYMGKPMDSTFMVTIEVKDGKSRIEIRYDHSVYTSGKGSTSMNANEEKIKAEMLRLTASLSSALKEKKVEW